ncbi:MAG: aminotransferase class I/II-fold pyridoxal phosphate-dependent enzyme, partial [Pseudomonadota bacterium]|nr:aminotransferase class I/II-fold pyridoxal phosphate-dependent enzyme [Pseudomonadota bacterium]
MGSWRAMEFPASQPHPLAAQQADLAALAERSRQRFLSRAQGADFSSNDYLALAGDPHLGRAITDALARGVPVGAGGSRLLRGNHEEHELLESEAAALFGCESALFLANGYTANSALLATLPQRGDAIFHDALVHASAHEGMRLTRAECVAVAHNDADAFADALRRWRADNARGTGWIAVESLYSMDGDRAPLAELARIADRYGAVLLADDAHTTGVFGAGGRGLAAELDGRENAIVLRTCGKALGAEGALLCGPRIMRDHLV